MRTLWSLSALSVLLVACHPAPPADAGRAPVDAEPPEVGSTVALAPTDAAAPDPTATATPAIDAAKDAVAPQCPGSFAAAQTSPCTLALPATRCVYAEGECACTAPQQCGGAYMPHPLGSPGQFACVPSSPSTLRHDGCPFSPPKNAASCAPAGLACEYGPCFWSKTKANCAGGKWSVVHQQLPPPP